MCVFVVQKKKGYEMRIRDWSSDVCSSDLLDGRAGTRAQKSRPVGLDLAPELLLGPISNEGALGAIAFDEAFAVQDAERLADGGARHAIFGGQFLDRWNLDTDLPLPGRDNAPEQCPALQQEGAHHSK